MLFFMAFLLSFSANAETFTYTYDSQHRLVQASHGESEKVFYNYDAAGNVDQHVTITEAKYLQSWLLYFACMDAIRPSPVLSSWETTLRSLLAEKI